MTVMRVTLRTSRGELAHWSFLIGMSFALHLTAGLALIFLPMAFRPKLKFPEVYTVDLMSLPAGAPGPKAGGPEAPSVANPSPPAAKAAPPVTKPAPKPTVKAPAPPPPKAKAAIKIPEKPTEKSTKPKPAEKMKETPKSVPEPKETAAETDSEQPGSDAASKGSEKSAQTPASGSQTPIAGLSAGGQGSGEGAAGAGGGGAGGMLDDATFQYGYYLSNMSGMFSRNWTRPIKPDLSATLRAIVHFRIQKDGKLTDIVLEQSSGDAALDCSALRAVQDSNPLPPLPYQYAKDSLGVHFFFDLVPD